MINKSGSIVIGLILSCVFNTSMFAQSDDFFTKRGDVLDVLVMDHGEFSISGIIVLPDGTIQYPGIGVFKVAGMTPWELRERLEDMLQRYLVDPIVSVFVKSLHDQMLNVLGHVRNPGQYQVFEPIDLYAAIGRGGGIRDLRRVRGIYIIHENQSVEVIASNRFTVRRIFSSGYFKDDEVPLLYAGDTLYIKEPRDVNWARLSFFASAATVVLNFLMYYVL